MIIVLLLLFQSICLYCQRLVLYVHDKWINPKNVRLIKEAAEASPTGKPPIELIRENPQRTKKRPEITTEFGAETCRFCANTPQGYCRHHFHLQELQLQQKQQKRFWNNIVVGSGDNLLEQRQLRKQNRELKRNLKNRLSIQKPQQQQQQQRPIITNLNYTRTINGYDENDSDCCYQKNNCYNGYKNINTDDDAGYYTASTASLNLSQNSSTNFNNNNNNNNNNLQNSSLSSSSSSTSTSLLLSASSSESCLRNTLDVTVPLLPPIPVENDP